MNLVEILRSLVAIPTVSRLSNRPLIEWIQRWFADLGWQQRVLSYRDADGIDKLNLLVSPGSFPSGTIAAELAVVCHTDTVPFDDSWPDATRLFEQDGNLHGCGSCDVKGFLACMLAVAAEINPERLRRPFVFVFTADEEIGCQGAKFLLAEDALRPRYAIVGEPTSLEPACAGKGYALAEVQVTGHSAHSAYPEAGRSAILAAARMLRDVEHLATELQSDRNDAFSPAWTTLNIGEIHGGIAKNIVPAKCSFLVEWRPIPSQDPQRVGERLRQIARQQSGDGIHIEVSIVRAETGFETSAASPVLSAILRSSGAKSQALAFGTEAPWLAKMGAEVVVFGPGSMLTAHSPRECVPKQELDLCVRILHSAIEHLCAEV